MTGVKITGRPLRVLEQLLDSRQGGPVLGASDFAPWLSFRVKLDARLERSEHEQLELQNGGRMVGGARC